jgi:hypothetical protein
MQVVVATLIVLAAAWCWRSIPTAQALTPVTDWESGFATCVYCSCMEVPAVAPLADSHVPRYLNVDAAVLQVLRWAVELPVGCCDQLYMHVACRAIDGPGPAWPLPGCSSGKNLTRP